MRNAASDVPDLVQEVFLAAFANADELPATVMSRAETDAYFKAERLER